MFKKQINFIAAVSLLLFLLAGCTTVPLTKDEGISLKELCDRYTILWEWDSVSQVVTLSRGDLKAKALIGSDLVIVGTQKVQLSAPLKRGRGIIIVPADFERRIIEPLFEKKYPKIIATRAPKIIIDAGHGGKDPGAVGFSGTKEKDIALDIVNRLTTILQKLGFEVQLTREGDEFISLPQRTEITSAAQTDLFVSIHANASLVRSASGIEVYTLRTLGKQEKEEVQRKKNHEILFNTFSMKRDDPFLESMLSEMLYTYKSKQSPVLASYIVKGMSIQTNAINRGVKTSGFFVLRNTLIPAVLVEVGFLSNPQEEKLLKDQAYRQKIAESLAVSIMGYTERYLN